jgi:putative endonuclease
MKYVYLLESINFPNGPTLGSRTIYERGLLRTTRAIIAHRKVQAVAPYIGFTDESKAIAFERYLKTASGRAFANKRLR